MLAMKKCIASVISASMIQMFLQSVASVTLAWANRTQEKNLVHFISNYHQIIILNVMSNLMPFPYCYFIVIQIH